MNLIRQSRLLQALALLSLVAVAQACVPIFSDGEFQTLKLSFRIGQEIDSNQKTDFQTMIFPEDVKVGKRWLQISGRIIPAGDAALPKQIRVDARLESLATGRPSQAILVKLKIDSDGTFSGKKKIKKDIAAGEMMGVTLQPVGRRIPANSQITMCVDLVQKKDDLEDLPVCATGDGGSGSGGSGGGSAVSFSSIQNGIFTPTCAVAGCHSAGTASAGLVLASGQAFSNLVNVPSTQVSSLDRVEPGDAERSYLVKKLRGDGDISGSRMPRSGPPLSASQINDIISWIESGAPNN